MRDRSGEERAGGCSRKQAPRIPGELSPGMRGRERASAQKLDKLWKIILYSFVNMVPLSLRGGLLFFSGSALLVEWIMASRGEKEEPR